MKQKRDFEKMLIGHKMPSDEMLADSLSQIGEKLCGIEWHPSTNKWEEWKACKYKKMNIVTPCNGIWNRIVIALHKEPGESLNTATLYLFPEEQQKNLENAVRLAKQENLPLYISSEYKNKFPERVLTIQGLVQRFGINLEGSDNCN